MSKYLSPCLTFIPPPPSFHSKTPDHPAWSSPSLSSSYRRHHLVSKHKRSDANDMRAYEREFDTLLCASVWLLSMSDKTMFPGLPSSWCDQEWDSELREGGREEGGELGKLAQSIELYAPFDHEMLIMFRGAQRKLAPTFFFYFFFFSSS